MSRTNEDTIVRSSDVSNTCGRNDSRLDGWRRRARGGRPSAGRPPERWRAQLLLPRRRRRRRHRSILPRRRVRPKSPTRAATTATTEAARGRLARRDRSPPRSEDGEALGGRRRDGRTRTPRGWPRPRRSIACRPSSFSIFWESEPTLRSARRGAGAEGGDAVAQSDAVASSSLVAPDSRLPP